MSSISGLTAPSRSRNNEGALETLASVAGSHKTPNRGGTEVARQSALEEEEEFDEANRQDSPESDEEDEDLLQDSKMERMRHEDENYAPIPAESDFTASTGMEQPALCGAPIGWKIRGPPEDWERPQPVTDGGEPGLFEDVDNPGGWNDYTFQPKYEHVTKRGKTARKYLYHQLPSGARPVPEVGGKREVEGFRFHCKGWKLPGRRKKFRSGATRDNMFPESRKGCLDAEKLSKLGLRKERMAGDDGAPDLLWFHQLIMPMADTCQGRNVGCCG